MTFSIGLRTIFRPQNYCRQTITRLAEAGVLCHPSVVGLHVVHGEGCVPNVNGVYALRRAAQDCPTWVLFLEDDIDIIDDFVDSLTRWLTRFAHPGVLAYPLGSFYSDQTKARHAVGAWSIPLNLYYGSQAVVFRTMDALDFSDWLMRRYEDQVHPGAEVEFDLNVSRWHKERRPETTTLITPAPCFVDHVGEHSLMGSWTRTGPIKDFAGRNWSYRG